MKKSWQYLGVFLNDESRKKLLSEVSKHISINKDWRVIAEHMTVVFNSDGSDYYESILSQYKNKIGSVVHLKVVSLGVSSEAIAVHVFDPTSSIVSQNLIEHITVAVAPGVKPVRSNYIESWKEIPSFTLTGTLELL